MHSAMPPSATAPRRPSRPRALLDWLTGWWKLLRFAARLLVLAFAPSSYRPAQRRLMLHSLYLATAPLLPVFAIASAVAAQIIIRIVLATALSYGLSRYALDVLVRTLVLELIPLSAALFAAVRYTLPAATELRQQRLLGLHKAALARGQDPLRDIVLPRALAGVFAALTLTLVSSLITLVLSYLAVYGFTSWGLAGFTRTVGQVFSPVIVLIFGLKTLFLSLAVALIPMVPLAREDALAGRSDIARLARLLAVVLLIELLSLVGNYY
jgi:phospholipid/cholesterol/gamma-HCH transport system permease protein